MISDFRSASQNIVAEAARLIRSGGIVAFPTETYYGLAADPLNENALKRIFALKKRSTNKALLTLVAEKEDLSFLTNQVPLVYGPLIKRYWPGPLTLLVPVKPELSPLLTGKTPFVGVRVSAHPIARQLCDAVGGPITGTSANISGQPAATTAVEVSETFGRQVDLVIDGDKTPGGQGSTLVHASAHQLSLIRPGVIPFSELQELFKSSLGTGG